MTNVASSTPVDKQSTPLDASNTAPSFMELVMAKGDFSFSPTTTAPNKDADLSVADRITRAAKSVGVDATLAREIAYCESSLRQFDPKTGEVVRGVRNPSDIGLFQINEKYHLERSRELGFDIHTTEGNIAYALYLLKQEGSRHWNWSKPCWSNPSLAI